MSKETQNEKQKAVEKKYLGKTGLVSFGGLQIQVKVIGVKILAGREFVQITPTGRQGGGSVWKYVQNIAF